MNDLLTISLITKEALRVLENNLVFLRHCNRNYDDKFAVDGAKIGDSVNIRKPVKYVGRTGQALSTEVTEETSTPFQLTTQFGVDIEFTSAELALKLDDFSNRILKPAMAVIANKLDSDATAQYSGIWNSAGTPGTTPGGSAGLLTYLLAGVELDNSGCPQDEFRGMFLSPKMQAYIVDALKGLFQQATAIASQYMKGKMGEGAGFSWFMDQNMPAHTAGTYAGTPLVNGASQTGATINIDGWSSGASTLNEGDIFTIDGVYSVVPHSRISSGELQKFRVSAATSDAAGVMATLPIEPSIIVSGKNQTVSGSPANNAPVNVLSASGVTSRQGIAMHRDAITFASADLTLPRGVDMAGRANSPQVGVSVRMVRQYDINTDKFPMRTDVLYGVKLIRPELACRVHA